MNPPGKYPEAMSVRAETRLTWLVAAVTSGLVIVAVALALDLHNQRRRLEDVSAQLKETSAVREVESKSLSAQCTMGEAALQRARELSTEQESDLKKLGDLYAQREPMAKQAAEVQDKLTGLAKDLLDLARTDPDARDIVRKYNIQQ
jgi:hypothetical protein